MKLYTENDVRKAALFSLAEDATMDKILDLLTPIELPSDEEQIKEEAKKEANNNGKHSHIKLDYQDGIFYGFVAGAKWMKEQILKQNK